MVGISLFRGENPLLAGGETDIEYWAVCRDLPANAHWTGANVSADGSRKEIPQKEQCSNTWGPCPSPQSEPFTGEQDSTATCTFECDTGYTWNVSSQVCEIPFKGIFYGSGTITVSDGTTSITIMDRNLGATVA
ncbi:MAG: hypothetical protein LBH96_02625 [Candidatus Peribacteria bacterium]|nr:hypothetical protein [Candidatus Peribacteria bacterium]